MLKGINKVESEIDLIDFSEISWNIREFNLSLMNIDKKSVYEIIYSLGKARTIFNDSILFLKSLLDPDYNSYIIENETSITKGTYVYFLSLLGIYSNILDTLQKDLDSFDNQYKFNLRPTRVPSHVYKFKTSLEEGMKNLIINPLHKTLNKFFNVTYRNKQGKIILKDREFFLYLLYKEIISSLDLLGNPLRNIDGSNKDIEKSLSKFLKISKDPLPSVPEGARTVEEGEHQNEYTKSDSLKDALGNLFGVEEENKNEISQ